MQRYVKSINDFPKIKAEKGKISMVTCYDYSTAKIINGSSVDTILVGDSVGMVFAGCETTLPVTVDEMIYHAKAVRRGAPDIFTIVDLPFLSYHISVEDAVKNAGRIMKESNCSAVKLEGGADFVPVIKALVRASIPVVAHLGLTPQSVHKLGGFKVQGKLDDDAKKIIEDAKAVQDAGAFMLVLEMVPEELGRVITEALDIPTIGIGGGRFCDGQVLVINDLLGMNADFTPKFLKKYSDLAAVIKDSVNEYDREVKSGAFPAEGNVFK